MGQQYDLAGSGEANELGVDCRFVLEHVQPRTADLAGLDHARKRVFVDHLAAGGVDDVGGRAQQLQPAR